MKAIIPVAGIGSRLRPHTHTQPKSLIPVAGKPILAHIIDELVQQGITDFIFIIGYMGDKIEKYVTTQYPKVKSQFVIQTSGKGTAHALWLVKDLVKEEEDLLIVFGDTIFKASLEEVLQSEYSMLGVKKVDDPRDFGVAEINDEGFITRLVEKPRIPKSNLALVGVYKIKNAGNLFNAIQYVLEKDIKTNDEYNLTDVLMHMVSKGAKMKTFKVENWFDCGKKDILLETNAILLKEGGFKKPDPKNYVNTIIIPPVFIGKDSQISNSIIGPFVSIGEKAIVDYAIIKNSIIGPYSQLEYANLQNSIIGNDASLKGSPLSLNLGDSTEINLAN
jgi:glucose-1-phosphate thymidylyltransferase